MPFFQESRRRLNENYAVELPHILYNITDNEIIIVLNCQELSLLLNDVLLANNVRIDEKSLTLHFKAV